ncbi:MAG: ParA family protein [Bifidobacteriaceae bacterium]|nr:ParA family protein [Bifidobacteriaceae bacterium]
MADVSRETSDAGEHFETASEVLSRIFGNSSSGVGGELAQSHLAQEKLDEQTFPKPKQTRLIAFANQKGGVGKTTTAVNLAAAWAEAGMNVLFIDLDPQGNASSAFGIPHPVGTPSIYDVIEKRIPMQDALQKSDHFDTLDVVPSTLSLSGTELEIADLDDRWFLLRDTLDAYLKSSSKHYDYVAIDCPPSIGLLVLNALGAVHEVIIPVQAQYYALEGLSQLVSSIEAAQNGVNPHLIISGMLVTMYDRRTVLSKNVYEQLAEHYPDVILKTYIPSSVKLAEAPSFGETAITYDPKGPGTVAYREAALEIAKRSDKVMKMLGN